MQGKAIFFTTTNELKICTPVRKVAKEGKVSFQKPRCVALCYILMVRAGMLLIQTLKYATLNKSRYIKNREGRDEDSDHVL